ncbi:MAG: helix-turn-helix domain-containing protein [Clostridiales bacterium]|jgi:transcriptional regulator with XRE-family HTH domain|nr:helix-turn-helix domain-containing protein [Clostridiales bacterium]
MKNVAPENLIKDRLSETLKHVGVSYRSIAKQLNVSPSLISQYASGKKLPRLETFVRLCTVLDVAPEYILGFAD